jgi:hypothetical protein
MPLYNMSRVKSHGTQHICIGILKIIPTTKSNTFLLLLAFEATMTAYIINKGKLPQEM